MPRTVSRVSRQHAALQVALGKQDAVEAVANAVALPAHGWPRRSTTARITALRPGASPPPVLMAMRLMVLVIKPFWLFAGGFGRGRAGNPHGLQTAQLVG